MKKIVFPLQHYFSHCYFLVLICIGNLIQAQEVPGTVSNISKAQTLSNSSTTTLSLSSLNSVGLQQIYSSTGHYTISADGIGSNNVSMNIRVNKPNTQATVLKAILFSTVTPFNTISNGCVTIGGSPVNWDGSASVSFFTSYWADVTTLVAEQINAFPSGISTLPITECNTGGIDGEALLVIFNDPATTEKTIIIMGGAMNPAGDNFSVTLAQPIDPSQQGALLDMGLGIGYSYQQFGGGQVSQVSVNGQRITSSAGGEDDGASGNGALITVGGIGDDHTNPANPFADPINPRTDDELYNILPFITNATISLTINTINPSLDDNIFLAYFVTSGAAVVGEGILLSQTTTSGNVGDNHTVKATLVNSFGQPISNRLVTFTILSGPNAGGTYSTNTDVNGGAFYTYTGSGGGGTDNIQACFTNSQNQLSCSNTLSFEWTQTSCNVTVSAKKFYDLNADGIDNDGIPVQGWNIILSGTDENSVAVGPLTQSTGTDGTTSFTSVAKGSYTVAEGTQGNWISTTPTSIPLSITDCTNPDQIKFGNVCIGAGTTSTGTFAPGYWTNKNGQSLITGTYLCELNNLCLRDASGNNFDPVANCPAPTTSQVNAGKTNLKNWLTNATATNMSYMLSAQLAAMKLNVLKGIVNGTKLVYAPGTSSANAAGFATVNAIMTEANDILCANAVIDASSLLRIRAEAVKNALENANNNKNFVQAQPCSFVQSTIVQRAQTALPAQITQSNLLLKATPNPSRNYFNVQIKSENTNQYILVRIFNSNGQLVEVRNNVKGGQLIQIGNNLKAGVYLIEAIQGNVHQTQTVIKQ